MPSNKLENKYIDVTKYEVRGLWTGKDEDHTSDGVGDVEGYPFEPPDDLGGWHLAEVREHDNYRFFTLWVRERIKLKTKPALRKREKPKPHVAADLQAVIDETKAAVTPQPAPKKKRGRPSKATNGATGPKETDNLPDPVENLPEYNGK